MALGGIRSLIVHSLVSFNVGNWGKDTTDKSLLIVVEC